MPGVVTVKAEMGELPFLPEQMGSYWSKTAQVDVVAINWRTRDILLGECEWGKQAVGRDVVEGLLGKTDSVLPPAVDWRVHYVFFARDGFTPAARALAQARGAMLVTLAELENDMVRWLMEINPPPPRG